MATGTYSGEAISDCESEEASTSSTSSSQQLTPTPATSILECLRPAIPSVLARKRALSVNQPVGKKCSKVCVRADPKNVCFGSCKGLTRGEFHQ